MSAAYAGAGSTASLTSAVNAMVDEIIESAETEAAGEVYDMYEEAVTGKEVENGEIVEEQDTASQSDSGAAANASADVASDDFASTLAASGGTPDIQSTAAATGVSAAVASTNSETTYTEPASEAAAAVESL